MKRADAREVSGADRRQLRLRLPHRHHVREPCARTPLSVQDVIRGRHDGRSREHQGLPALLPNSMVTKGSFKSRSNRHQVREALIANR